MRCTVKREVLLELVGKVSGVVSAKPSIPMAGQIALEVSGQGQVRVGATNLDTWIEAQGPCEALQVGRVAVPAKRIQDIVAALTSPEVELVCQGDRLDIVAGRSRLRLVAIDLMPQSPRAEEGLILNLPDVSWGEGWKLNMRLLKRLSDLSAYAAERSDKDSMRGVLCQAHEGELRFIATNGYRLAMARAEGVTGHADTRKGLLLPSTVALATKVLGPGEVELVPPSAGKRGRVGFATKNVRVVSRTLDPADFPPYERVMSMETPYHASIKRTDLTETLARMQAVAGGESNRVTVSFRQGEGICRVETPDVGGAEEPLAMDYSGEALDISFNVGYLVEVVERGSGDRMLWRLAGETKPAFFEDVMACGDGAYYLAFVSPLRRLDV